jgi:hypothetical protein
MSDVASNKHHLQATVGVQGFFNPRAPNFILDPLLVPAGTRQRS